MAKVTLIGSGKTAHTLGKALFLAKHELIQVWSRSEVNAIELAKKLNASATTDLSAISGDADIYLIAVKDDAIADVSTKLIVGDKIIAHTSGIKSKELLRYTSPHFGILYPFISMTKETDVDFEKALFMIEGSDPSTIDSLTSLAQSISGNVKLVQEDQRQSLHLAAVFAHNFTNHMYAVSERILADKGLSFDDIRPLIASHIANVQKLSPSTLQTGPAIRHDQTTIDTHLHLLDMDPSFERLYLIMTEAIQQWHKDKQ